jgi:hypothetical protein
MIGLQDALGEFNKEIPGWYGWINLEDGEVYSNLKLNDDTATMPTEDEVNAKIAELEWKQNRISAYPQLGEQFDMLFHAIDEDETLKTQFADFHAALKEVKDDNPKPSE